MTNKPFPGFPWFSYPAPEFVTKNKMLNLEQKVEELEKKVIDSNELKQIIKDALQEYESEKAAENWKVQCAINIARDERVLKQMEKEEDELGWWGYNYG